jgi:predicted DNA-binding protein with PD1-like motif
MEAKSVPMKQLHFLRIDPGEEIISMIQNYAQMHEIHCGVVSLVGAMHNVRLIVPGNADRVEPIVQTFSGKSEIVASGNISLKDGTPFVHLHGVRIDDAYQVKGGHIVSGEVILTVEVTIIEGEGEINRTLDPLINLHRLSFK